MMRLASQPQMPPTISQIMIPMSIPSCFRAARGPFGGRSGATDAWRAAFVPETEGYVQKNG
jgi:hypothetical protein